MKIDKVLADIELWIKHPNVYKVSLTKALSSGLIFKVFNDDKTPEELKERLREALPKIVKNLDVSSLLKGYGALAGISTQRVKSCVQAVRKDFIRKPPSKRPVRSL